MRLLFLALCLSVSVSASIKVLDDRVTDSLAAKFKRGEKPRPENFRFGEVWNCFHHYSQPREGREENSIVVTEFKKMGNVVSVLEGKLYRGQFLKGQRFDLAGLPGMQALKDPFSSTYLTRDPKSDSLVVRFGEPRQFGTSYMICRPREDES